MHDAAVRNRMNSPKGENHLKSVLSEEDVIKARQLASRGWNLTDLSSIFPVKRNTIEAAVTGKSWRFLLGAVPLEAIAKKKAGSPGLKGENSPTAKLKELEVQKIKSRLLAGGNRKQISKDFNISISTVHAIAAGRIWSHV
jgi:hypothetical protein